MASAARIPAALILGLAAGGTALAGGYPYSGFFTTSFGDLVEADVQLTCASSVFRQDKDGSFVNYHVDLPRFQTTGEVRYLRYSAGICSLEESSRIESCRMTGSTNPDEIGAVFIDVIRTMAPDVIETAAFDTADDARAWIAGGQPEPTGDIRISRCPGFDDETLRGVLTEDISQLGPEDLGALLSPTIDADTRATMAAILAKLHSGQ